MNPWSAAILCFAVGLASCSESGLTGRDQIGSLHATIRSAETTTSYTGTGFFVTGPEIRAGVTHRFQLFSKGLGANEGQSIGLFRFGAEVPAVGIYELAPVDPNNPVGFVAYYYKKAVDGSDSYVSLSGTVVITAVTADRIEGTLSVRGAQYCSVRSDDSSWCVSPLQAAGNRQIEITGSFIAERQTEFVGQPLPL